VIPILEGGGLTGAGSAGVAFAPQNGADTGSGGGFPDVLDAQRQPVAAGGGEQLSADTQSGGGNLPLPGGKNLPLAAQQPDAALDPELLPPDLFALDLQGLPLVATGAPGVAQPLSGSAPLSPGSDLSQPLPGTPLSSAAEASLAPTSLTRTDTGAGALPVGVKVPTELTLPAAGTQSGPSSLATVAALPQAGEPSNSPPAAALPAETKLTTEAARLSPVGQTAAALAYEVVGEPELEGRQRPVVDLSTPVATDSRPAQEALQRGNAELRLPPALDIANAATVRLQSADDAPAVRLAGELATAPIAAEGSRPAAQAATALPTALLSPVNLSPSDTAAPLGSRLDVTGVLVAQPGEQAWNAEVAGRLSLMLRNGASEANLQLNPPELGRMEVKIATDGDQARVLFSVQGAETRDLIEQALPRLRDLLEQGGLSLSSFDVADQASQGRDDESGHLAAGVPENGPGGDEGASAVLAQPVVLRPDALVDYYA